MPSSQSNSDETKPLVAKKPKQQKQKHQNDDDNTNESEPVVLDPQSAASVAKVGAAVVNQAANNMQEASSEGFLSFRLLGFVGGAAMVISNGLVLPRRYYLADYTRAVLALYGTGLGIFILLWDFSGPFAAPVKGFIHHNLRLLDTLWGRGAFYLFVGGLQAANWTSLDWFVGGFLMLIGFTALVVGLTTASDVQVLEQTMQAEQDFKDKWDQFDADQSGYLDVKELTAFVKAARIDMNRREIAAFVTALDKDFDEKISYDEFHAWWLTKGANNREPTESV